MKYAVCLFVLLLGLAVLPAFGQGPMGDNNPGNDPISLELRDTPIRTAIDSLFKGTGVNYAIEQGVTGNIPNLSLKEVTFDQALKTLTKAAGLTYRKDGDIYLISMKQQTLEQPTPPAPTPDTPIEEPEEVERKVEKVALNYADAQDIAGIFGGGSFSSRSAHMAGGNGSYGGGGGSSYGNSYGSGFNSGSYGNSYGNSYGSGNYGSSYGTSFGGRMGF